MRLFFLTALLFCIHFANAKNYYIATTGNDANNGTSTSTPWKSISKVNSYFGSMAAGDSILFKRGDVFYGAIRVNKSGSSSSRIIISAYGTGTVKPVISGGTIVTSWTSLGNNLWKSNTLTAKKVNVVTVSDASKQQGRYPNANAASSGYLYFETVSSKSSVTDNQLTSTPNWKGGEIAIKPNPWTLDEFPVTSHSGGTINFSGNTTSINKNYGYFIQNHPLTLDQQYEWYYDVVAKQLTMYSTSSPSNVKVASIDTLCYIYNRSYITIKGLSFQGANQEAISLNTTTGITIDGCTINNSGTNAVRARNSISPVVQNCSISNSYNIGVDFGDINNANGLIKNNTIARTGIIAGMGYDLTAINTTGSGHTIQGNTIDSCGFVGIRFGRGSNITIKNNVINTFCFVKSDGGGIYTWNNYDPATTYYNNKIIGNILMNGIGNTDGTAATIPDVDGIYMDDNTGNVEITDNTVTNVAGSGMYIHNNFNMNVQRNTLYNNGREQVNFTHNLAYLNGVLTSYNTPLRNITFKKNILFSKKSTQTVFEEYTILDDVNSTGTTDSNYYCRPANENDIFHITKALSTGTTSTTYNLGTWKKSFTKDAHSKTTPVVIPTHITSGITGTNKVTNGQFTSSTSGVTAWSSNNNQIVSWDNSSKITGTGSLKVSFPSSVAGTYTYLYSPVGSISSSKNYVLKFTTVGTTNNGGVDVYLRKAASPYTTLSSVQTGSFGITKKYHEYAFTAPASDAAASYLIEVNQNSGTVYIDDIELYEATVTTLNIDDYIRFEYNATSVNKTVSLSTKYFGIDSTVYTSNIVLAPYSSKILIKDPNATLLRPMAAVVLDTTSISTVSVVTKDTTNVTIVAPVVTDTVAVITTAAINTDSIAAASQSKAVNTFDNKAKIICYPNPSSDGFNLLLEGKLNEKIMIAVYNIEGKLVYQTNGSTNNGYRFGNNFVPGVYMVKVMQGNSAESIKVIKGN